MGLNGQQREYLYCVLTTWHISEQKIDSSCTQLSLYNVISYFWFDFISKYYVLKNNI